MISPAKVETNSAKAGQYFREHFSSGDYYEQEGKSPGQWFGKGAELLGLRGEVSLDEFIKLADNRNPHTGEHLTQRRNETRNSGTEANRRCYQDFSISPPKSVSIQAIAMGDTRIVEAHNRAVREAAKVLEGAASARVRSSSDPMNGKDRLTGNITAAIFQHDTSRAAGEGLAPDPQLHSHLIIFNATQDAGDGNKWKALQNYNILRAQKLANAVYDHELTRELHQMGYATRQKTNGWELDHISDEMVHRFSKRNRGINAVTDDLLAAGSTTKREELNSRVAHDDRMRKQPHITTAMLRESWSGQMGVQELEKCIIPTLPTQNNNHPIVSRMPVSSKTALDWAKSHLFERNAVVRESDILTTALNHVRGSDISLEALQSELLQDGELLREIHGERVTTRETFNREMYIINTVRNGKGKFTPLAPGLLESASVLDDLQTAAATQILRSKDFATNFRGVAGAGKTFTILHVANALEANNKNVLVLAPQNGQVQGLIKDGLENSMTVSSFLASKEVSLDADSVVVIDEAGQIAGKDMEALLKRVSASGGRVILSGDTRQHGGVEATDALVAIERYADPHSAELGENAIRRQLVKEYRQAVALASRGDSASSFEVLDKMGAIREVRAADRQDEVAALYLEKLEAGVALVVSQTNRECDQLNESIRSAMIKAGQLDATTTIKRPTLKTLSPTNAQKQLAGTYAGGTVILLHKKVGEFKARTECQFVREAGNGSIVISSDGKEQLVKKKDLGKLAVLETGEIEIAVGDHIQLKANCMIGKKTKLANGAIFEFRGVDEKGRMIVEGKNNKRYALPANFKQLRHGYAVTSYSSQGKTVDHVIISDSQSKGATNQHEWYVSISRGRQSCSIITADKKQLAENIQKLGDRELASDLHLETGQPHAVFAVVPMAGGRVAATTRPVDREQDDAGAGKFGLPGGKVDHGETPEAALIREAREEGWQLSGKMKLSHKAKVQGKEIWWYTVEGADKLTDFKEAGRISPVAVDPKELVTFGNDRAIPACLAGRGVGAKIKSALASLPEYWEHFISRAGEWFVRGLGAGRELERSLGVERDRSAERELRDTGRER